MEVSLLHLAMSVPLYLYHLYLCTYIPIYVPIYLCTYITYTYPINNSEHHKNHFILTENRTHDHYS